MLSAAKQLRDYRKFFNRSDIEAEMIKNFGYHPKNPKLAVLIGITPESREGAAIDELQGDYNMLDIDIITYDEILESRLKLLEAQKKGRIAFEAGALGVVIVYNPKRFQMWDVLKHARRAQYSLPNHDPLFHSPCVEVMINKEPLSRLFQGRTYNPVTQTGDYSSFAMDDAILSLDARCTISEIQSANVVAMVEGTDPKIRDKYVTVGAHLDHVGLDGGMVFNGADDDASGSVAVLEVAEAIALDPPGHSVIFILYTGEEMRFMGSQHFVLNPPVPLESIRVNINLDMVGRPDGGARELATNVGGEMASALREIISEVNTQNTRLRLDHAYDQYFMMSDHVSFYLSGIPVIFLHTGDHADLHRPSDDADKIDYDFLKKTSQLTYFLIMELGSLS